jgi:hypothetical protein
MYKTVEETTDSESHQTFPCYYRAEIDHQLDPQKCAEK